MSRCLKVAGVSGGILAAAAAAGLAYRSVVRPWCGRWGATDAELVRRLPGDELVPKPKIDATHGVVIAAPPGEVWPWLVQIGQGRGGFYSYDWIENALGLDIRSAEEIRSDLQDLQVGDTVPLSPDGMGLLVVVLEPGRTLVLHGDTRTLGDQGAPAMRPGDYLAASWGFYLLEQEDGSTRLVERFRADWNPTPLNTLAYRLMVEPGAFIMERKMLLGIKERVERRAGRAGS